MSRHSVEPANDTLITDTPIDGGQSLPDLLDRTEFANLVANRITSAAAGSSVVFGLSGPWGSGKTSTLNLIHNALRENENWKVVFFTPWAVDDPYALAEEFYRTIASAMPADKGRTARKLLGAAIPAAAAAAKVVAAGLVDRYVGPDGAQKAIDAGLDAIADQTGQFQIAPDPFSDRFAKIQDAIAETDTHVLVIVDDIDRLHGNELLAVMKSVRLLGRFNGVHYLLSYDIETVTDVLTHTDLAHEKRRRAERYLEKIVQYPFELPPIQLPHLRREFAQQLTSVAQRYGFELGDSTDGTSHVDIILEQLPMEMLTLRTVHRLLAQLDVMLALTTDTNYANSLTSDEINLIDAVLLTNLRLEYPELYSRLRSWKSDLTKSQHNTLRPDEQGKELSRWHELIAPLVGESNADERTQTAYQLLYALFPDALPRVPGDYRPIPESASHQIRTPQYFDRYFAFGFPAADLRDADVRRELEYLISTGDLPAESLIRTHAESPTTAPLLQSKVRAIVGNVLRYSEATQAGKAAKSFTRAVPENERRYPHRNAWWAITVYILLEAAVRDASDAEKARTIIACYLEEFGTDLAVLVLDVGVHGPDFFDPENALWEATEPVRQRVHDETIQALFDHEPAALPATANWYWAVRQDGLLEHIRDSTIQRFEQSESTELIDIATRFVTYGEDDPPYGEQVLHALDTDSLMKVLPSDHWPPGQIPQELIGVVDTSDLTYPNRRRFAANALHNIVNNRPFGTGEWMQNLTD
ncbi:KAP family P-loop NTPase fold protein [Rhodococcus qingshengii]|uniref:KAP family P-loop NTPase fold protein n=1 Tax=Rhodococcus qingshengii TaxID=334542 RepID=UPI00237C5451|nr:P-loop NTPase fold protein [Rhodococcus qingshengii]WCT05885.1 P-loop NTPase fold protein [Rhodococcus qingshengii]